MSELDNLEPIVEDKAEDTAIDADNTHGTYENMTTEANDDAKKLTNDLRRYIVLYTIDKNEVVLGILKQANWSDYLTTNDCLKMLSTQRPKQNYETVMKLI